MRIAVIGSGVMGAGLVQFFCELDSVGEVLWVYRSRDSVDKSLAAVLKRWATAVTKGKIHSDDLSRREQKITLAAEFSALSGCHLVLEAVSEDLQVKLAVFEAAAPYIGRETIVATNTSSLAVSKIFAGLSNADSAIGLHFFNPVPAMKLVEVVAGEKTSQYCVERCLHLLRETGKIPILVRETPGFVVNRLLIPMINEAAQMLSEGVATPEDIDAAMVFGASHSIGPLALADLVGLDVCVSILDEMHRGIASPRFSAAPLLRSLVSEGKLGRKSGRGFYVY